MSFNTGQMAQLSLIGQIGGAASSAVGSYYGAKSQASTLNFQAGMADTNARMSETAAQGALMRGQRESGALTLKAGQLKGRQRAAMAANGIDLGEGNAAEIQASTDVMKEIDANTIESNAVMEAWGYRTQGVNASNEALMARATAGSISPFGSAAGSLLGSAGSVASSWYSMNKAGALDGTPFGLKPGAPIYDRSWNK